MTNRFVLDTNLIVSALLFKQSVPRLALEQTRKKGKLLHSPQTLAELDEVLRRAKFNKYVSEVDRLAFLNALVRDAIMVMPDQIITACRDPKDNKFLELAVSGQAACIITGDLDLLSLHPFHDIPIYSPNTFLEMNNE